MGHGPATEALWADALNAFLGSASWDSRVTDAYGEFGEAEGSDSPMRHIEVPVLDMLRPPDPKFRVVIVVYVPAEFSALLVSPPPRLWATF